MFVTLRFHDNVIVKAMQKCKAPKLALFISVFTNTL